MVLATHAGEISLAGPPRSKITHTPENAARKIGTVSRPIFSPCAERKERRWRRSKGIYITGGGMHSRNC